MSEPDFIANIDQNAAQVATAAESLTRELEAHDFTRDEAIRITIAVLVGKA